VNRNR